MDRCRNSVSIPFSSGRQRCPAVAAVTVVCGVAFQSPSHRGGSAARAIGRPPYLSCRKVSIPFSSGRQRCPVQMPFSYKIFDLVSIPFSSGWQRCPEYRHMLAHTMDSVSIPFSSGWQRCRCHLRAGSRIHVLFQSPSHRGGSAAMSESTCIMVSCLLSFNPLLIGVAALPRKEILAGEIPAMFQSPSHRGGSAAPSSAKALLIKHFEYRILRHFLSKGLSCCMKK